MAAKHIALLFATVVAFLFIYTCSSCVPNHPRSGGGREVPEQRW